MSQKKAREIVIAGERAGLSHKQMAQICQVSVVTISRWKFTGRARTSVISKLERHLDSLSENERPRKYLDEASLEDLADRARQLGFRITFADVSVARGNENLSESKKGGNYINITEREEHRKIRSMCDKNNVVKLCNLLIEKRRGKTLGDEIKAQLNQKFLNQSTYERLSRWVNPARNESFAQPIAAEISMELFGEEIKRV
jgi:hypothetical protein